MATVSHNGKKLKFKGVCSVVEEKNSWKYGHELHITVHCNPLSVVESTPHKSEWSRIEIALPFNMGLQWLQRGLDSAHEGSGKRIESQDNIASILDSQNV